MRSSSFALATLALTLGQSLLGVDAAALDTRASGQQLTVNATPSKKSQFGVDLFIETNINSGTDGGLYAELINNRAFQVPAGAPTGNNALGQGTLASWSKVGASTSLDLTLQNPLSHALPKSVAVTSSAKNEACGLTNSGYGGFSVKPQKYDLSFYARSVDGKPTTVKVKAGLYSADRSRTWTEQTLTLQLTSEWKQFKASMTPTASAPDTNNVFSIKTAAGCGSGMQLNLVSLFPPTWKGTVARADLAQALADTKPVLVRVPGGNDLEGNSISAWFNWTNAVGDVKNRPGRIGTWIGWNTEGFGLLEMMDMIEKMGAQAVLGIYAGYSLDKKAVPKDQLGPYIESALNQLHFLLDTSGKWADLRASYGRAAPYKLEHVEIGNEDWIYNAPDSWPYRYPPFRDAIAKAFPQLELIASSPYSFQGQQAIDQHDYNTPSWFIDAYDKMDSWPRNGTKIYELEYAVINSGLTNDADIYSGKSRLQHPTLIAALAEATFLLGAERNGDLCHGAAYAPIFMNEVPGLTQWTPDLISFDAGRSVKSISYYVQQAFGMHRIDNIHDVKASTPPKQAGLFHSVGSDAAGSRITVKLVNTKSSAQSASVRLSGGGGKKVSAAGAQQWQLSGSNAQASNTMGQPNTVVPKSGALPAGALQNDGSLQMTLPPYSFTIVTLPLA
ncbi:uncharacterized protein PFL1_03290 [Pseudozyma flocculosa PF-1]|uniref:non-reducing end alpha-L-arabinofuranosidase n=2 Tax=Pseudozyma flocculosa TaxID=84751 RepID=A0A5C3F648_9BASI|nr:uncharacterized protein PFL1_03290 [Pseudozyma flocculosa PF-1]EPQ29000.1 hypothetical protein PFL1_03290 [Pseudozyma flocculosa PF-1]SPO39993.1 related to Alpha-L-arabinofuranosidase I precursor [Pseudozyma flocculosa]